MQNTYIEIPRYIIGQFLECLFAKPKHCFLVTSNLYDLPINSQCKVKGVVLLLAPASVHVVLLPRLIGHLVYGRVVQPSSTTGRP
jgi:hypothetical protein